MKTELSKVRTLLYEAKARQRYGDRASASDDISKLLTQALEHILGVCEEMDQQMNALTERPFTQ
jgi:hypothetical protein